MTKVKAENIAPRAETIAAADRLHSAAIHLLRRVRKQDEASGIGPAQLSALSVLVFAGPKTLGELAAAEQVKPPTMSRIVTGLERSRLIEITRDPGINAACIFVPRPKARGFSSKDASAASSILRPISAA